jgi:hypothetical protein
MRWARYLPQVPVTFSRAAVVVLCGLGLAGGLIPAARKPPPMILPRGTRSAYGRGARGLTE